MVRFAVLNIHGWSVTMPDEWINVFGGQLRASERSRFCWSCGAALASSYEPHLNSPLACPDCRVRMEGIRESNDDSPLDAR